MNAEPIPRFPKADPPPVMTYCPGRRLARPYVIGCCCSPLILWRVLFHRTANIGAGEDLHLAACGTSGLTALPSLRLVLRLPIPPPRTCRCRSFPAVRSSFRSASFMLWILPGFFVPWRTYFAFRRCDRGWTRTSDFEDKRLLRSCRLSYTVMNAGSLRHVFLLLNKLDRLV